MGSGCTVEGEKSPSDPSAVHATKSGLRLASGSAPYSVLSTPPPLCNAGTRLSYPNISRNEGVSSVDRGGQRMARESTLWLQTLKGISFGRRPSL